MKKFVKNIMKNLDAYDISLTKLSVMSFVLAMVSLFPSFTAWVQSVNPTYFMVAFVIFVSRPVYKIFFKK